MKKRFLYLLFLFFLQFGFAQNSLLWQGYYSYNSIKDISASPTAFFAASENALFSKNINTGQLKTTNTIDGLSGQTITSLYYSAVSNKTIVGYENGLMIVINEKDGSMLNIVDIISKQLPANLKKINHFMEYNGIVYVSCDFGIVQFNLATMQFGDTYFIGDNGAEVSVTQTTVFNGYIYAATANGIRNADVANKNLVDFNQWTQIATGSWASVETFNTELLAINNSGYIHRYNSSSNAFIGFNQLSQSSNDMRATTNNLIVTTLNSVYIYNTQLALVRQINSSQIPENNITFTCATSIGDVIYIGTTENGIYATPILTTSTFENILPSGPSKNNIFSMQTSSNVLWAVYGDYVGSYNPYPLDSYGISKYQRKRLVKYSLRKSIRCKIYC